MRSTLAVVPKTRPTTRRQANRVATNEPNASRIVAMVTGCTMRSSTVDTMPLGSAAITNHTPAAAATIQPARRSSCGPGAAGRFAAICPATSTHSRPTDTTRNGITALLSPSPSEPMAVKPPSWWTNATIATTKVR